MVSVIGQISWLEGFVTAPFEVVAPIVGVVIAAGLVYMARRAWRDEGVEQAERERRTRQQ